jgi:hypothetical protein
MNLVPVRVEHADGDGVGRPVNVRDKRNCADSVPRVGSEFANYVGAPRREIGFGIACDAPMLSVRSTIPDRT